MRYLLLIYGDEKAAEEAREGMTEEQGRAYMDVWFKYTEELQATGKMLGGDALMPTSTATTVRGMGGDTVTSDGPFAETKEQLAGFYAIEADDLDEAIEWAAKMPNLATGGSVEVRPIMEIER